MVVIGYDRYNVIVKGFSGIKINMAKAVVILVSTLRVPANGLGLKFLMNRQLEWFEQSQRSETKIRCSIPLFMKVTIPGTHGTMLSLLVKFSMKVLSYFSWQSGHIPSGFLYLDSSVIKTLDLC